jgi:hypothetical protein
VVAHKYCGFFGFVLVCWSVLPYREIAMKAKLFFVAALALAILSNAFANANEVRCFTNTNTTGVKVPSAGGPCPKIAASYAECVKVLKDRGWDSNAIPYACTTQGYKN